jgi:presenilin 1
MILSALLVVYVNDDNTREAGAQAMSQAYLYFDVNDSGNLLENIGLSLANGLVMVSVICLMTFVIVLLYRFECMKCLIGYMMLCSTSLLGVMGGNLYYIAIQIYRIPIDKLTYFLQVYNFAIVGIISIFYMKGIPKFVTQGYLIATACILAWHLDYFDEITTWTLLICLALYDLCAVLTPCGPLKALVNLMSRENAPEMPGLLYEADLPPEARRPGRNRSNTSAATSGSQRSTASSAAQSTRQSSKDGDASHASNSNDAEGPVAFVPLAIARVYNLRVLAVPERSQAVLGHQSSERSGRTPLLDDAPIMPENPSTAQLMADVKVRLPAQGGRIERIKKNGKTKYLERDRHGNPKRILWVDTMGRVFAETGEEGDEDESKNTIRLGLGDFIFYSVLVGKAAQYSFTTFAACMLVILAGLGGTLVLLSVYNQALPALPISIFLGVFFYIVTRIFMEPWVEAILYKPFYV